MCSTANLSSSAVVVETWKWFLSEICLFRLPINVYKVAQGSLALDLTISRCPVSKSYWHLDQLLHLHQIEFKMPQATLILVTEQHHSGTRHTLIRTSSLFLCIVIE